MKLPPIITATGLVLLASPVSLAVAQETGAKDAGFEEIVVTGTFIRRSEGFTPASLRHWRAHEVQRPQSLATPKSRRKSLSVFAPAAAAS